MTATCKNCKLDAEPYNAKNCKRLQCGLSLLLSGQDRFQRKYKANLEEFLTPELMYHIYTGEDDEYELDRVAFLDHTLQDALLAKAEREWPARLEQISRMTRKEKRESKKSVQKYLHGRKA